MNRSRIVSVQGAGYRRQRTDFCFLFSVICFLFLPAGCRFYEASEPMPRYSYLSPYKDLTAVGRVAIVELDNDSAYPKISTDITEALFLALQKKQLFGLTMVHQDDAAWRSLEIEPDTVYTLEQLFVIYNVLKCDALLVGTVTEYKPYPHMTVGLRLRLLDLSDGQLLWAAEQVWDSADKTMQRTIKKYYQSQTLSGQESLSEQMTIISPLKFIGFIAYEVAETLQPK
jgi:hypothetical protein